MKTIYLTLIGLLCIVCRLAAFDPQDGGIPADSMRQDLELADHYYRTGRLVDARPLYRKYEAQLDTAYTFRLASTLILSDCIKEDFEEAYKLLGKGIQSGHKTSIPLMGWLYYTGHGIAKDTIKGLELITTGVNNKDPWGYYFYGICLQLKDDVSGGMSYLKKAAKMDHAGAACMLGVAYQFGFSGTADLARAQEWYEQAIVLNSASAHAYLARLLSRSGTKAPKRNPVRAFWLFSKAAELGDPERAGDLGVAYCYREGVGTRKNLDSALYYYRRAGAHRQSKGYANLGYMYEMGIDVAQNADSAIRNYVRAADLNDGWTCHRLGKIFSEGILVDQNDTLAARAIKAGAAIGDLSCLGELALYYKDGRGVVQSLDSFRKILTGPELKDRPYALYHLGLLEDSLGQRELAIDLLKKSADKGYDEAMMALAKIYKRDIGKPGNQKLYTEWIENAIKAGSTDALFLLGFENYYGINRPKDPITGNRLITGAAWRGNRNARDLISLYPGLFGDGRQTYERVVQHEDDYRDYAVDYEPPFSGISSGAMDGNPDAQFLMGKKYLEGVGVKKNFPLAIQWFQQAAAQGHGASYFQLGYMYETGLGLPQSYVDAMSWYELAATKKVAVALNNIGSLYYRGKGVSVDKKKAAEYYKQAADLGEPLAKNNLGFYYLYDCDSLAGKTEQGVALIIAAAEDGDGLAQHNLWRMYAQGHFVKKDMEKAESWLVKAAAQNRTTAMYDLAKLYYGRNHTDTNARNILLHLARMDNAVALANLYDWYKLKNPLPRQQEERILAALLNAPENLDVDNQIALMKFYRYGIATAKDNNEAIALGLQFAGPGSDAEIDAYLGELYAKNGVPDQAAALKWYKSAADKGNIPSAYLAGLGYYNGKGIPVNDSLAAYYIRFAAQQEHAAAMRALGSMYLAGRGVGQGVGDALYWLEKAADKNDIAATQILAGLYQKGDVVPADPAKRLYWLERCANQDDLWAVKALITAFGADPEAKASLRKKVYWLEKAVVLGDAISMNDLGECYYLGRGVKKDYTKALNYYQQAVDRKEPWASYRLSQLYLNGLGVAKNETKARELLKTACSENIQEACQALEALNEK